MKLDFLMNHWGFAIRLANWVFYALFLVTLWKLIKVLRSSWKEHERLIGSKREMLSRRDKLRLSLRSSMTITVFIVICIVIVFHNLFLAGSAVFGDAPYFYSQGLKELVGLPNLWTTRGISFGGINLFIFIYPVMVIYGALGTFLNLSNDLIIRLVFYYPAFIFGGLGVYYLCKQLKLSKTVTFFATFVYLINTYFILLVDGGQVGVMLACGLFPFVLNFLLRNNYLISLIAGFGLMMVDFGRMR